VVGDGYLKSFKVIKMAVDSVAQISFFCRFTHPSIVWNPCKELFLVTYGMEVFELHNSVKTAWSYIRLHIIPGLEENTNTNKIYIVPGILKRIGAQKKESGLRGRGI